MKYSQTFTLSNGEVQTHYLNDSLVEIATILENKGFTIRVSNFGTIFEAYLPQDIQNDGKHLNGLFIHSNEVHRHNGTDENVNIDLRLIRWDNDEGLIINRGDKKVRFRIDASEKVKNQRADAIIEQYMKYR